MSADDKAVRRRAAKAPAAEVLDDGVAALMTLNANLQRASARRLRSHWRERKLSERGLYALELIASGLDRPGKLVEYFDVLPSTITFETDKLVAAGLLRREADPSDRRAIRLTLTEAGRVVHQETVSALNTEMKPRLARLSADELKAFMATFRKLLAEPVEG